MPFFVKRNGQAVPIVSEPNVINDTTASQNTSFSGSKVNNLIANHTHASNQINAMTGYSKPSSTSSITSADSLNTAIGKVEKGLEGKQSPLSLGQYSGLDREIQILDNEEVGQTWYNTGIVDIEPSSSEGKLTISKVDDSVFPGSAPYTSEDIDIPGWEKVENSPITVSATGSDLTLSTSSGNVNAITIYGKSEVVDGTIISAGEGWSTVDLGTVAWNYDATNQFFWRSFGETFKVDSTLYSSIYNFVGRKYDGEMKNIADKSIAVYSQQIKIKNISYTVTADFQAAMQGVLLCYELADPTQGNCIAVKTDNGSGIDGTMATFTTGTPLRGIPDADVRDVMTWDGSAGEVTKVCASVNLRNTTWELINQDGIFATTSITDCYITQTRDERLENCITSKYPVSQTSEISSNMTDKSCLTANGRIYVRDTSFNNNVTDFVNSLTDVTCVYRIANPTITSFTATENASIAGLRTFTPQTHAQNNAGVEMTVEAYAGTENGKAVNELKQDVQSEISELKITQSATLTLTTAGWTNNAQTITYAHDTAKRNVIDVDPSSVEEWANCGVLATTETASGITFTCKTVPENALTFRVTSMGCEICW